MRQITVILLYLAGGMMLAGNVYVTLLLRKKELGLFLALGARRYQLILLILTEVLLVGLSGALLGFILMLPMALWQYLSSSASVQVLLGALGKNLLLLLVSTVTASALFGAVPAWYASRLPVSEVLTGE
jgi:putative ABC transport system permease protein